MLHAPPPTLAGTHQVGHPEPQAEASFDLSQITGFLRRQWPVILLFLLTALALAAAYLFVTPPQYTANAVLMLDTRRLQLFQQQSVLSEISFDAPAVESQVEVLKSRAVASQVIKTLELTKDAEFTGNVTSFSGSIVSALKSLVASSNEPEDGLDPNSEEALLDRALKRFEGNLTIKRAGRSYVIEIGFRSLNKDKAARIANAIGEAYIMDQLQSKYVATRRATDWLKERIGELRQEAVEADRATLDFRNKNNMVDAGGRLLSEQQLLEVNTQLTDAKARTAEAKARLDRVTQVGERGIGDAAVVDALQNTVLNRLQQQFVEAAKRETELSARYGVDHPAAVNLRKEMETIQAVSKAEVNRIAESQKSEYEIARSREVALQARLDELSLASAGTREAQVGLRVLESSANAYRSLHDNFLQRFVEATQQQSFPNTEARVITEAFSAEKTHPKTLLVLGLAGVLGLGLGCGAAFARESLDHVFRTARQVEQALGVECIGVIPAVEDRLTRTPLNGEVLPAPPGTRVIAADLGMARQVVLAPFSRFSETIRSIKVTADTSTGSRDIRVIGMASAVPGEGKSTVSCNLAQLIAHSGRRALLIDGDLRNPTLTRRMAKDAEVGVLEVLDGSAPLSAATWRDPITGLDFLPAVIKTPIAHTSEIVASAAFGKLLTDARDRYDYVVVDFPPLAPVVDARAAAHHIDAFVMVIAWGDTSPEIVLESLQSAEIVHSKILGAVLNKANANKLKKLEAYKGKSYHKYYGSYGSAA